MYTPLSPSARRFVLSYIAAFVTVLLLASILSVREVGAVAYGTPRDEHNIVFGLAQKSVDHPSEPPVHHATSAATTYKRCFVTAGHAIEPPPGFKLLVYQGNLLADGSNKHQSIEMFKKFGDGDTLGKDIAVFWATNFIGTESISEDFYDPQPIVSVTPTMNDHYAGMVAIISGYNGISRTLLNPPPKVSFWGRGRTEDPALASGTLRRGDSKAFLFQEPVSGSSSVLYIYGSTADIGWPSSARPGDSGGPFIFNDSKTLTQINGVVGGGGATNYPDSRVDFDGDGQSDNVTLITTFNSDTDGTYKGNYELVKIAIEEICRKGVVVDINPAQSERGRGHITGTLSSGPNSLLQHMDLAYQVGSNGLIDWNPSSPGSDNREYMHEKEEEQIELIATAHTGFVFDRWVPWYIDPETGVDEDLSALPQPEAEELCACVTQGFTCTFTYDDAGYYPPGGVVSRDAEQCRALFKPDPGGGGGGGGTIGG